MNDGLLLSGPTAVPPYKTLFKIEINFATNFTKLCSREATRHVSALAPRWAPLPVVGRVPTADLKAPAPQVSKGIP